MVKRRRQPFDPLAAQPRTPKQRPGDFNEQAEGRPDPNVEFLGIESSGAGGSSTDALYRLGRAVGRAVFRRGRERRRH